jgi:phospholipid/cholesterol/gamma-HCH transport system substrate-binding protein
MKYFTKEVQIALVAVVAIVVLFFGMQFLKGLKMFSSDHTYFVRFSDVSGLSANSPVYANGYKIGVVQGIDYNYQHPDCIIAPIGVTKEMLLPQGTQAEITSDLLGNVKLELRLGDIAAMRLAPGDTINGGQQVGVMGKAADMIPQIEQMLPKLDSILASVNTLLADPAISQSVHNVEQITASLTTTSAELHQLTASLNRQMPTMMQKADGVLANTQTLTQNLSDLDIAATMNSVNATLANVQQMTAALNSKDGTLGLLMRDKELYRNLSSTMAHTDSLVIDLKSHPKRYVHFSVFGRKDK